MGTSYYEILDHDLGVVLFVDFRNEGIEVIDYSLVLLLATPGGIETIRVYDGAHGFNEMHRYTRDVGKEDGVVFSSGTLGEGMRMAMLDIKERYLAMIEGWEG